MKTNLNFISPGIKREMNTYPNSNHYMIVGLCDILVMVVMDFTLWLTWH